MHDTITNRDHYVKQHMRSATFNSRFVLQVWFLTSQRSELQLHLKSGGKAPVKVMGRETGNKSPAFNTKTKFSYIQSWCYCTFICKSFSQLILIPAANLKDWVCRY